MRILLIGNTTLQNDAIKEILTSNNCEVDQVDPEEFEESPEADKPIFNFALVDLTSFPGDLEERIKMMREKNIASYLIVVHNYKSDKLIQPLLDAGADHYFPIDSNIDDLLEMVNLP